MSDMDVRIPANPLADLIACFDDFRREWERLCQHLIEELPLLIEQALEAELEELTRRQEPLSLAAFKRMVLTAMNNN
jgi:hypothetical protein